MQQPFTDSIMDILRPLVLEPLAALVTAENILQLCLCLAAVFGALVLSRRMMPAIRSKVDALFPSERQRVLRESLTGVVFPFTWLLLQTAIFAIGTMVFFEMQFLHIVSVLLLAWIIIRLSTGLVSDRFWAQFIAVIAWSFAALSILGWLEPLTAYLDELSFGLGKYRVSLLGLIKGLLLTIVVMWAAVSASRAADRRIRKSRTLTPSVQELTSKLIKLSLIFIAIMVILTNVGIDLTALAFFSGALGVGIGFGLQKPASNLICGVILLMDRSIKPGDVIELQDSYGWVNALSARFVSVITRDGKEHLIPNEELIALKVINWSYSDTNVRLKVPVRISYSSDVNKAMDLLVEAAIETPRVLQSPAPRCLLMDFSENAVMLELRIWASDPINGVANLKSAVLVKVWNKFKEHGIHFPFPQRDVHLDISQETLDQLLSGENHGTATPRKREPRKTAAKKRAAKTTAGS